jgi:hypothetical protein
VTHIEDYVVRLEIAMDESQIVELLQSSDYLKQNVTKLTVVSVLIEVRSEIHFVPLYVDHEGIWSEEHSLNWSDEFTFFPRSLIKDLDFIVESLG